MGTNISEMVMMNDPLRWGRINKLQMNMGNAGSSKFKKG
jgi:hypothetical protein